MTVSSIELSSLERELCRLEDQMNIEITKESDLFCSVFGSTFTEQVCFREDNEQVLWTNLELPSHLRTALMDQTLMLDDIGGARPRHSIASRLPEGSDMHACVYPIEDVDQISKGYSFRAVSLLRYQNNVIWAWAAPIRDEDWEFVSQRCNDLNRLVTTSLQHVSHERADTVEEVEELHKKLDLLGSRFDNLVVRFDEREELFLDLITKTIFACLTHDDEMAYQILDRLDEAGEF